MLVLVCIGHLWICFYFTFPLKARKDKIYTGKTPRSVRLRGVQLRAVLAHFGFSNI